jgi:uracil-DNA glycosylase family 4
VDCENCPLKAKQKIYGEGSRIIKETQEPFYDSEGIQIGKRVIHERDNTGQYDVVVVGMAPAREEVEQGRVLVGASGKVLRGTLKNIGIEEYYLCNILLCQLEEGDDQAKAVECCGNRVIEEILERKPKLVIGLGDMPLRKLAPEVPYSITEVQGRVIPSLVGPFLPVTHPAYFWRRPDDIFDFFECMRSGPRFLRGEYRQGGDPTYTVITPDNLDEVRNKLDRYEELAIDTETTGFHAYGWEPDHMLEMGIAGEPDHAYIVPRYLIHEFKELLETKKGIYWNAQFDAAFLTQEGIKANVFFDGMLAHYTMDERSHSHGLKKTARIYLGVDDWERGLDQWIPKRKSKSVSYEVIPTEVRYAYLAKDVTYTLQLKYILDKELNRKVFDTLLMPGARMFIEIEHKGMRVDAYKLMNMAPILEAELSKIELELQELTGEWINPNSSTQIKELVYNKLGIPVDHFFGMSTGKEALEPYKDDPIIGRILEFRQHKKLLGTYVEGFVKFVDKNFRIHPQINLFKAVTGRLASENPSIMNIKANSSLKEVFLPDAGQVMLYGDIKGNELRWYGLIGKDEYVLDNFRKDYAARQRGASKEELDEFDTHYQVALIAAKGDEAMARDSHFRTAVKAGVFGQIYQRSRASMARQFGEEVVDLVMEGVSKRVPGITNYYKDIIKQVRAQGYLESYFGRKRRFGLITPDSIHSIEKQAVNFPIQSSGSDVMLLAMLHLFEIKDRWGIWPFWPVHDSITMSGPSADILPEIKKELEDFTLEVTGGQLPFVFEVDWGINWAMQKTSLNKEVSITIDQRTDIEKEMEGK